MSLPLTYEDLTPSWFSQILNVQVKPDSFKMIPNVQAGEGFLSLLARVKFETENDPPKQYNLIVKMLPDENGIVEGIRETVINEKIDLVEINTYKFILSDLMEEIPGLKKYICPFYFGGIQVADPSTNTPHTSVLVLEDLRPLGYTTKLYNKTLAESEFNQGIDFLATLHAASRSLEQRKGLKLPEIYEWFPTWLSSVYEIREGELSILFSFFPTGFENVYAFLKAQSKPDLIPHFKNLEPRATKILQVTLLAAQDQEHACINHFDLWSHNLLVNNDPKKPIQVIDWQLIGHTDPTIDLGIYSLTTLPIESMNETGISEALESYFNRYTQLCAEKEVPIGQSFDEFKKFFLTYGLSFTFVWYCMSTVAIVQIPDSEPKLLRALELLVELGTTDFLLSVTES